LHLFRGTNEALRAIFKKAKECLKDSITVEEEDPKLMAELLSHCGELWVQFWRTKGRPKTNGLAPIQGQNITPIPNNNGKRPFVHGGKPNGVHTDRSKGWMGKGTEVNSGRTYQQTLGKKEPTLKTYPFAVLGRENLS
jgi:hypothetical protein